MLFYKLYFICICFVSSLEFAHFANAALVIKPRDTYASEGHRVQLHCSTSDLTTPVSWQYIPVGHGDALPQPKDVFIKGILVNGYDLRFKIHNITTGAYDLVIPSVQISDAGTYRCRDEDGRGEQVDAALSVAGTVKCQMFATDACGTSPENVTLECNMTFSGKFAPLIQWVTAKGDVVNQGVIVTNHSDRVTSTLVIEVDNPSLPLDYTCQAKTSTTSCKPNNSVHCQTEISDSSTHSYEPIAVQSSTCNMQCLPPTIAAIILGIILAIILVIVIVIVIKILQRNRNGDVRIGKVIHRARYDRSRAIY